MIYAPDERNADPSASVSALIADLAARGIALTVELKADPDHALSPIDRAAIAQLAPELRAVLASGSRFVNEPLTPDQIRLWWIDRLTDGNPALTITLGCRVTGALDVARLRHAIAKVRAEQPCLRRCFPEVDGAPAAAIIADDVPLPFHLHRADGTTLDEKMTDTEDYLRKATAQPLSLARGPLFRVDLIELERDRYYVSIAMHHIISDLRSLIVFIYAAFMHYVALEAPTTLPEAARPRRITDAQAMRLLQSRNTGTTGRRDGDFWLSYLKDARLLDELPLDRPRSSDKPYHRASCVFRAFPQELYAAVVAASAACRKSFFPVACSAFQVLLHHLGKQDDFLLAVPLSRFGPGLQNLIGFLATPRPLRCRVRDDMTFRDLVEATYGDLVRLLDHRDDPMDAALASLRGNSTSSAPTLFPLLFSLFVDDRTGGSFGGLTLAPGGFVRACTDLDLFVTFHISNVDKTCYVILEYNAEIFGEATAESIVENYVALLTTVAKDVTIGIGDLSLSGRAALGPAAPEVRTVNIVSTFTADPMKAALAYWARRCDSPAVVELAGYNQVFQEVLDPQSALRRNRRGANLILLRPEDWLRDAPTDGARLTDLAREHVAALTAAAASFAVPTLVMIAPPSPAFEDANGAGREAAEAILRDGLAAIAGVAVLSWRDLRQLYPVADEWEEHGDRLGHVPYTPVAYTALATFLFRRLHLAWRRPFKVVVVDCDNTLWKGVVGEDGCAGLEVTAGHRRLQERLVEAAASGLLVCLCSKNVEDDVFTVLTQRSDMPLRMEHVTAHRINWLPKSDNIIDLARKLGLGLDGFVFLDDNPIEIAEVRARCPAVTAIRIPEDADALASFADHLWPLDCAKATAEDERRTRLYREADQRAVARGSAASYEAFIASLDLAIRVEAPRGEDLARVAQLTQRTNQFNINGQTRQDGEVRSLAASADVAIRVAHVQDRFGSYGLVGLFVARKAEQVLRVETFLMSCRVLGRGVEHRLVNEMGVLARSLGLDHVHLVSRATARNLPARRFLDQLPATRASERDGAVIYALSTDAALGFAFSTQRGEKDLEAYEALSAEMQGAAPPPTDALPLVAGETWEEIAGARASAMAIHAALHGGGAKVDASAVADDRVAAVQQELVAAFAAVLNRHDLATEADFAELGVGSLQAVQIYAQLKKRFADVDFSLRDFLDNRSIRALAQLIARLRGGAVAAPAARDAVPSADLRLAADIVLAPTRLAEPLGKDPEAVLLTGATGFLGGYLVRELLSQCDAQIHCIVRSRNADEARERLRAALRKGGHLAAGGLVGTRIVAITGDIEEPRLGLSQRDFDRLAEQMDAIYHNGAAVNFLASYAELSRANVVATEEVLRLASGGRLKPVHYVSTVAVFDDEHYLGRPLVREDELPGGPDGMFHGYAMTKWVSELMMRQAQARGIPVSVYRPGNITGDSRSGLWFTGDAFTRFIHGCVTIGRIPAMPATTDWTPVDYVAAALVTLSLTHPTANRTYHLVNTARPSIDEILKAAGRCDVALGIAPHAEWLRAAEASVAQDPASPMAVILPLFMERLGAGRLTFLDWIARRPMFDTTRTIDNLAGSAVACRRADADLIATYFDYLRRTAYLKAA